MKLYKYVNEERIDIIQNCKIRFSSPLSLNDPFELKPNVTELSSEQKLLQDFEPMLTKTIIEEYSKQTNKTSLNETLRIFQSITPDLKNQFPQLVKKNIPAIKLMLHRALAKSIGMLCLSENPINLLMWAHYANSHRGFVIEFEPTSKFFNKANDDPTNFQRLHKVKYVEEMPRFTLETMGNFDPFIHKSIDWFYEQEWRMLLPLASANTVTGDGPLAIHLFNLPKSSITGILLGAMATKETETTIVDLINANHNFKHVKLYKAFIDDQNYKLNIYPLLPN